LRYLAIALILASAAVLAQPRPVSGPPPIKNGVPVSAKYLSLIVGASETKVSPGGRIVLLVRVTPKPKIHVYAPGQDGYIAADLSVTADPAFTTRPPVYPPSKPYTFGPTAETVKVYAEPFVIGQDLVIAASPDTKRRAELGDPIKVAGAFRYQACDDAVCYRPETVALTWTLRLTAASSVY
jgi:hypothetical protein